MLSDIGFSLNSYTYINRCATQDPGRREKNCKSIGPNSTRNTYCAKVLTSSYFLYYINTLVLCHHGKVYFALKGCALTLLPIGFALRSAQTSISMRNCFEMCVYTLLKANSMGERARYVPLREKTRLHITPSRTFSHCPSLKIYLRGSWCFSPSLQVIIVLSDNLQHQQSRNRGISRPSWIH